MSSSYRPSNASPFGPERYTSGRDTLLFVVCVVVSVCYLLGPSRWGEATARGVRETVLVPFLWLQARAEEANTSRARFEQVESERDSAAWGAQALPELRAENDRLRTLLGLTPRVITPYRPAEVLRQSQITDGRTLVLGIGTARGVKEFDPVVSPEGLIGMVTSAERNTSVVMTWAHPEFRVSAATEEGALTGMITAAEAGPDAPPLLELRGVSYRDTIPPGTMVVTTGLGGIYPQGVPIGTVLGIAREQRGWERIYQVRPAANLGTTSHVLVLNGVKDAGPMVTPPPPAPKPDTAAPPADDSQSLPPVPRRPRRRPKPDSGAALPADSQSVAPAPRQPRPRPKPDSVQVTP